MTMILYQFPLSHYCEKVCWALDYKKLPYQTRNLIPGAHLFITKRLGPKSSVPILQHEKKIIQDSTHIIDYLDEHYPQKSLSPSDPNLRTEALEWEEYFDKEIGVHLRRFAYFHLLEEDTLVKSLLLHNAPWYGKPLYSIAFPLVKKLMKKTMNINTLSTEKSQKSLEAALEKLNENLKGKEFLVGKQFSRADLTAAALLGPLCTPPEHHFPWPSLEEMPIALQENRLRNETQVYFKWVLGIYSKYRHPKI